MDQATIDKLYEDFDIAIKPGQGFKYVRTRDILDRLNRTFEGNWGLNVKHHELIGDEVLVLVAVHLYDGDGRVKATQEGFGSAKKFRNTELGNTYKSATSKAVKSAVRNWGVALFLDEDSGSVDSGSTESSTPPMTSMSNTPPSNAPPSGPPSSNTPPSTSVPPSNNSAPTSVPAPPTGGTPVSMPPTNSGNVPPPPEAKAKPDNVPPPSGDTSVPPNGSLPTMSAVPGGPPPSPSNGNETHEITAVQKVAITSRLGAKGLSFGQISEEFYSTRESQAPSSIDGMMYEDALDMVAFLNTK